MGSHTKSGTTFCVCVGDVQCPKGAMTEAQKGLRERNMPLYSVSNYLLGFLPFGGRLASLPNRDVTMSSLKSGPL